MAQLMEIYLRLITSSPSSKPATPNSVACAWYAKMEGSYYEYIINEYE